MTGATVSTHHKIPRELLQVVVLQLGKSVVIFWCRILYRIASNCHKTLVLQTMRIE